MLVDTKKLIAPGGFGSNSNIFVHEPHRSMTKNGSKLAPALPALDKEKSFLGLMH